jgi:plastocyanin
MIRSIRRPLRALPLVLLCAAAFVSCGDGNLGGPSGPAGENEVRVGNNFFNPSARTVDVGTTVTWRWNAGATTHNVTFSDGPASTNKSSGTFQRTFSAPGTFSYSCTIHGAGMSGSVTVN